YNFLPPSYGGTETLIVPDPASCDKYYIFTSREMNPFFYSILDLSVTQPSITTPSVQVPTLNTWPFYCSVSLPLSPCTDPRIPIVSNPTGTPNQYAIPGMTWSDMTHTGPSGTAG